MMALESARRRVQGLSGLESAAPTSTILALLCILLLTAALDGHEWARGTALDAAAPREAVVSLSAVRLGAPDGKGGVEFRHPQSFKRLCVDTDARAPRTHAAPGNSTAVGAWCELRAAGDAARAWIWLSYLPLYATAALSAVLALAERVPAAKSARFALAAYGLTDAAMAGVLIGCWMCAWLSLFVGLACFAYGVPGSLGWGEVSLEASFGVAQLALIVMTSSVTLLLAKLFAVWDDEAFAAWFTESVANAGGWRRGAYACLSAQLLLLLLCAVRRIEWQALILLAGLSALDTGRVAAAFGYGALTLLSLLLDVIRLGADRTGPFSSGAHRFASACYVCAALLKPLALGCVAMAWARDAGAHASALATEPRKPLATGGSSSAAGAAGDERGAGAGAGRGAAWRQTAADDENSA